MTRFVRLGDHEFKSVKAARYAITEAARKPWPRILDGADREIALGCLDYHPQRDVILARGIAEVQVFPTLPPHGWIFAAVHPDGNVSEFSYQYAVNPNRASDKVLAALRFEVKDQIDRFRREQLRYAYDCEVCYERITGADCHVDHEPPEFAQLAQTFLYFHGPLVLCDAPDTYRKVLADRDKAEIWRGYHLAMANLRLLHGHCHLNKKGLEA